MDVVNPSIEIDAADIFQHCTRPLKCGPARQKGGNPLPVRYLVISLNDECGTTMALLFLRRQRGT